jgi:hypothetical protein
MTAGGTDGSAQRMRGVPVFGSSKRAAMQQLDAYTLEYDSNGAPAVELGSNVVDAIPRQFNTYGVTVTNPDGVPTQFRCNNHRDARGQRCLHALQPAPPPGM